MREIRSLDDLPEELLGGALSIGNFDGVHQGHGKIVESALAMARKFGGPTIVFTFDPHPVRLLRPELVPPPLTWTRRKAQLLGELGVDALIAYPTDKALLELSPTEFFERIVVERLHAKAMVEGTNFFFGKDRAGNVNTLQVLCEQHGIALSIIEPIENAGGTVSSSRIRETISTGDVQLAAKLLSRPYRVRGMVTHGAHRGSTIGFPTANLEAIDTLIPARGVYAGVAHVRGQSFTAAINIGPNPTFGEAQDKVEVHLIEFEDSIYGEALEVDFVARLRDIQQFSGVEELKAQLNQDIQRAIELTK